MRTRDFAGYAVLRFEESFETLRCWCIKAGAKPTRMRAVHVVEAVAERTVSVVSPNGYRVPEISLEEAMALLRAFG
jgi:hypothetical protein